MQNEAIKNQKNKTQQIRPESINFQNEVIYHKQNAY
jgi:hypothetical protein